MNTEKPILQLMNEFLVNIDISEFTRKKYRENMQMFIGWLTRNCEDVRNPKRSDILAYKQSLIESKKAATTIDAYMVPVRQFFKYLEDEGIYDNIAAGIHSPRRYQGYRKSYLQVDQVNKLLTSIGRSTLIGKRDYAIIQLMCTTGMRCVEVSRMDVDDIKPQKSGYMIELQGKGHINKDRYIHIPETIMLPIHNYLVERDDLSKSNPPLFVNHSYCNKNGRFTQLSISKIIKKYLRAIDINSSKITAHSLRHTAAINAIKAGAKVTDVQSMLGHRFSSSTDIYLRALEAETAEEGTAIRLLDDLYKGANNKGKTGQISHKQQTAGNL